MRKIDTKQFSSYEVESGFRATLFDFYTAKRAFDERAGRAILVGIKPDGERVILAEK